MSYNLLRIIEVFMIGFVVALAMTPVSIRIARRFDIIDRPRDDRRMHNRPIPRFGGLAIFLGATAAMIIPAQVNDKITVAILGGLLMYALGAADDLMDLKPMVKFTGQWVIATMGRSPARACASRRASSRRASSRR